MANFRLIILIGILNFSFGSVLQPPRTSKTFGLLFPILIGGNGNSGTGSASGIHDESAVRKFVKVKGQIRDCKADKRLKKGVCRKLKDCDSALSNKEAGVDPIMCPGELGVCCATEPRISERMCNKYKNLLRTVDSTGREFYKCPLWGFEPRITGGLHTMLAEFPHMVGLGWGYDPNQFEIYCGGTLISENFVLTAAHCNGTSIIHGPLSYILLGDISKGYNKNNKTRLVVKIKRFIKHPNHKSPSYNDIALIELEEKVPFSMYIFPACLPNPKLKQESKTELTMAGWGKLSQPGPKPDTLRFVNLTRIPHADCQTKYKELPYYDPIHNVYPNGIEKSVFCAGNPGKDTCVGDSGGPATVTDDKIRCLFYVLGVTSTGSAVCGSMPALYMNVQHYLDWIESVVWPN